MGIGSVFKEIAKSVLNDWFNGVSAREKKLTTLRDHWDKHRRGTPVIFVNATTLCQVPQSNTPNWDKVTGWHTVKSGQGAMLMNVFWPIVKENRSTEHPIRFVFWCNYSHYEYLITLSDYDGALPFYVLT